MARTITALFDTKADADAGAERLREAGVGAANVAVHDQTTHATTGDYSTADDRGLWASIKNVFVPKEDRHAYEEGIRRGGFLLIADVGSDEAPAAVAALERANSIDLDARSAEWRAAGWNYGPTDYDDEDDEVVYGAREPAPRTVAIARTAPGTSRAISAERRRGAGRPFRPAPYVGLTCHRVTSPHAAILQARHRCRPQAVVHRIRAGVLGPGRR